MATLNHKMNVCYNKIDDMDINTFAKTLSTLDDETQRLIANEYGWGEGNPMIYPNNDFGLNEICQEVSVEYARSITPIGFYSPNDKFVYLDENNHLISFNRIMISWEDVARWMEDNRKESAEYAWEIYDHAISQESKNLNILRGFLKTRDHESYGLINEIEYPFDDRKIISVSIDVETDEILMGIDVNGYLYLDNDINDGVAYNIIKTIITKDNVNMLEFPYFKECVEKLDVPH